MLDKLIEAITQLSKKDALEVTDQLLQQGTEPQEILDAGREAMQVIGSRFEAGEFFLPELIVSGDILANLAEKVKPFLKTVSESAKIGKVVIGTVEGDIHDIAKDIVITMLEVNGFEVIDMGVDVPPERFVEAIREQQVNILGLSGFLTLAIEPMRATIAAVRDGGPPDVKVMIGGGPVNQLVCDDIGADGWGANAMDAVSLAKKWAGVSKNGR